MSLNVGMLGAGTLLMTDQTTHSPSGSIAERGHDGNNPAALKSSLKSFHFEKYRLYRWRRHSFDFAGSPDDQKWLPANTPFSNFKEGVDENGKSS